MSDNKWVSMWGNAVSIAEHRPEGYAKDITLRYPIFVPFSGDALKFTLDNYCGTEAVTIDRVTVACSTESLTEKMTLACPVDPASIHTVTFDGNTSVTLAAAAARKRCDPVSGNCKKYPVCQPVLLRLHADAVRCIYQRSAVQGILFPRRSDKCPGTCPPHE